MHLPVRCNQYSDAQLLTIAIRSAARMHASVLLVLLLLFFFLDLFSFFFFFIPFFFLFLFLFLFFSGFFHMWGVSIKFSFSNSFRRVCFSSLRSPISFMPIVQYRSTSVVHILLYLNLPSSHCHYVSFLLYSYMGALRHGSSYRAYTFLENTFIPFRNY